MIRELEAIFVEFWALANALLCKTRRWTLRCPRRARRRRTSGGSTTRRTWSERLPQNSRSERQRLSRRAWMSRSRCAQSLGTEVAGRNFSFVAFCSCTQCG
eukprot:8538191-Pyramimonas_sp.AAC.1